MKIFRNVIIGSAILVAAGSAQAWWGGPFNSNGFGNGYGDGDMSFNMGFSGRSNVSGYGNGYGYNAPYYGYAPYGYAPYGYAPYGHGAPTAPAAEGETNEQAEGTFQPHFPGYGGSNHFAAHQEHMMKMREKQMEAMEAHRKAMQERMEAQKKAFEERYAMRSEGEESKK